MIFAFGGEVPYERRARHIATAQLYVSIAAIFVVGIGVPVLIFEIGGRLDEPIRATFTSVAGWAYLLVLAVVLVAYVRRVRRNRR